MARPAPEVKRERLNLDLHPDVKARIQSIQKRMGADSVTEVVRRMATLTEKLLDAEENGDTILLRPKLGMARQLVLF
jgi:hypothetical protein